VTKAIFAFRNFANAASKDHAEEPKDLEKIFSSIHTTLPTTENCGKTSTVFWISTLSVVRSYIWHL